VGSLVDAHLTPRPHAPTPARGPGVGLAVLWSWSLVRTSAKVSGVEVTRTQTVHGNEQGFATTRFDVLLAWARKYSMFMYPFATACCAMEFFAAAGPRFDVARFGAEIGRFSPRQADVLWVIGTISQRNAPVLKRIYEQMMSPKWVFAFGTCAASGGFYDNYATLPGVDKIVPVDIYLPGCPPRPEAVLDGVLLLQDKIASGDKGPGFVKPRTDPAQQVAELVRLRRSAADPRDLMPRLGVTRSEPPAT
jgi:NADH-quinone oxidoreductase subunit B